MTNFKYISAPAGAGKTTRAIAHSKRMNQLGFNVLFVVPTIKLADQIANSSNHIQAIHSNNTEKDTTASTIINAISSAENESLVITEESFKRIPVWHNKENWVVIKDEAHEPLAINDVSVINSINNINEYFTFTKLDKSSLSQVSVNNNQLTDSTDFIFGQVKQLIDRINNNTYEVLVDCQYLTHKNPRLVYSIFELPNMYLGFNDVIFMSANFEHTFLFHQWESKGVKWADITSSWKLPSVIPNTSRVKIHYYLESEWGWSKNARLRLLNDYAKWVNNKLSNRDFIYVKNNSDQVKLNGKQMPAVCHGLNDHRDADCFVSTSSYLIDNKYNPFYDHYNTSISDARSLRNTQMLFQQLMRCDLRNYESTKPIDLYVPTSVEAIELLQYIPDATIVDYNKTSSGAGSNYIARLNSNWSSAFNKTTNQLPVDCLGFTYNYSYMATEVNSINLVARKDGGIYKLYMGGDLRATNSTDAIKQLITLPQRYEEDHSIIKAIKLMQKYSVISIKTATSREEINQLKTKNTWFSNAIITEGNSFKNVNVRGVHNFLAFDFDNSQITLSQLKKSIFSDLEFVHYTSISHGQSYKTGDCFRVVIPCNRNMTVAEHARLMNYFEQRIMKFDNHGFDAVSKKVVQKWFFPHAESQITHVKTRHGAKQAAKLVLDVDGLLQQIPTPAHVIVPTVADLVITNTTTNTQLTTTDSLMVKIDTIINSMTPGNRSAHAVQIGGLMGKYVRDQVIKDSVFNRLVAAGVGSAAIKSAKRYAFK